jgi:ankyrin repeat protein
MTLMDVFHYTLTASFVARGNAEIIDVLIAHGADIEARSVIDDTPLLAASHRN